MRDRSARASALENAARLRFFHNVSRAGNALVAKI
jgi:hypothetical protein